MKNYLFLISILISAQSFADPLVRFKCAGPRNGVGIDIQGAVKLGRYYRMGHYSISGGQIAYVVLRSGQPTAKGYMQITSGDYQESNSAWFYAQTPQTNIGAKFELYFYGQSFVLPNGDETRKIPTSCTLIDDGSGRPSNGVIQPRCHGLPGNC